MKSLLALCCFVLFFSCKEQKRPVLGESEFQRKINNEFKDASKSPLKTKDLKTFNGLPFFEIDSSFVVLARLERKPDSQWFNMKTTTNRISKERIFGIVFFNLKGNDYQLNLYQGQESLNTEGMEDYLFLPFIDDTNGDSTYGGGRYIDLRIPELDSLMIDFNTAYSPYCAYNEKFSCPIVPRENYLPLKVEAGVKNFK